MATEDSVTCLEEAHFWGSFFGTCLPAKSYYYNARPGFCLHASASALPKGGSDNWGYDATICTGANVNRRLPWQRPARVKW